MALEIRLADGTVDRFSDSSDISQISVTDTKHSARIDGDGNLEVMRWTERKLIRTEAVREWEDETTTRQFEREGTTEPRRVAYYPSGTWTTYRE